MLLPLLQESPRLVHGSVHLWLVPRFTMWHWLVPWCLLCGLAHSGFPEDDGCYVATIFNMKTADCKNKNLKTLPRDLNHDLKVN